MVVPYPRYRYHRGWWGIPCPVPHERPTPMPPTRTLRPPPTAGACDNRSVGVIITAPDDMYLLFHRTTPPTGRAPVAGHGDGHAAAITAATADVREDIGLVIVSLTRTTFGGWRNNTCHHPGPLGPGHDWTIFTATTTGILNPDLSSVGNPNWYHRTEMQWLADRTVAHARGDVPTADFAALPGLEPVWVRFFHRAGVVHVTDVDLAAVDVLATHTPDGGNDR